MTGVSKFGCGKQTCDSASDDGDVCQLSDLPCPTSASPFLTMMAVIRSAVSSEYLSISVHWKV